MAYCDQHNENCGNITQIDKRVGILENENIHQAETNKQIKEIQQDLQKFKLEIMTSFTSFKAELKGMMKGWVALASCIGFVFGLVLNIFKVL